MSDFFYKEKIGPALSPVIKVKKENMSPTIASAIDNLLNPSGNMFTRANTVRNMMNIEKMSLEEASKALSLRKSDVADKLRLLEFSEKERSTVLQYGFSEKSALMFLSLDKFLRAYAMEYCHRNGFSQEQIEGYVNGIIDSANAKAKTAQERMDSLKKSAVKDIGFLLNSIEKTLGIAKRAGFDVAKEQTEKEDFYDIRIKVKKNK